MEGGKEGPTFIPEVGLMVEPRAQYHLEHRRKDTGKEPRTLAVGGILQVLKLASFGNFATAYALPTNQARREFVVN